MYTVDVAPGLHHLRLGIANAYLLRDPVGTVLLDAARPAAARLSRPPSTGSACNAGTCTPWC